MSEYIFIEGTEENDYLEGGEERNESEIILADRGDDILLGWGGDDSLFGEEGNDLLKAGEGDDLLFGGDGGDQVSGGDGKDTFALSIYSTGTDWFDDFNLEEDNLLVYVGEKNVTLNDFSLKEGKEGVALYYDNSMELAFFSGISLEKVEILGQEFEITGLTLKIDAVGGWGSPKSPKPKGGGPGPGPGPGGNEIGETNPGSLIG